MKTEIHPENYQLVIFHDNSTGDRFLIGTTLDIDGTETDKWEDGNDYPLISVDISSASHPFYTGKMKYVDTAGRVEKFQKKYNWGKKEEWALPIAN